MLANHLIHLHVVHSNITNTSPAYTALRPVTLASDGSQQSYQTMPCRHHIMKVPALATR
jgi:hypothetical protein